MTENDEPRSRDELLSQIEKLKEQLTEAEATLQAIRSGEVDALVVTGEEGEKVFTLKGAEHPYRILVEEMNEGAVTLASDHTILFCNKGFARILQTSLEKVIGNSILDFIDPDSTTQFLTILKNTKLTKEGNIIYLTLGGIRIPTFISFNSMRIENEQIPYLVVTDLTDYRKKEQSLLELEERYHDLFESALDLIFTLSKDGMITSSNPAFGSITGWSSTEMMNRPLKDIIHPDDLPHAKRRYKNTLAGKKPPLPFELRILSNSGNYIPMEYTITPRFKKGKVVGGLVIARDITERKRMTDALQKAHDELEIRVHERTSELEITNLILRTKIDERIQAESALRRSEERFRNLYERTTDGIIASDMSGTITSANPATASILGYNDPQELIGMKAVDLYVNADQSNVLVKELIENGYARELEVSLKKKDGTLATILMSSVVHRDKEGNAIYLEGMFKDISERKKEEEELIRRAKLGVLGSDVGFILTSSDSLQRILQRSTEAIVKHLDAAFARIWVSHPNKEMLELQASAGMYTHIDGPHSRIPLGSLKIGHIAQDRKPFLTNDVMGDPLIDDKEWVRKEGMKAFAGYPLIVGDSVMGVMGLFSRQQLSDFTLEALGSLADSIALAIEHKQAEEALEKANALLEITFSSMDDAIFVVDPSSRTIISCNDAVQRILGYSREEVIGRNTEFMYVDSGEYEEIGSKMFTALDNTGMFKTEYQMRRKNGEIFSSEVTMNEMVDEFGYRIGVLSVVRDITEHKKLEEIRIENEALIYANQVKSEFLTIMSHELRTPLTSIIGYSKLLDEKIQGNLNKKQGQYVKNIISGGKHLLDLINNMLDLAKIEAGKMELEIEKIYIRDTINETLELVREKARTRNISLKTEFDPQLEWIEADRQKFKQILFNLLSNALKFSKEGGGTVTIATQKENDMAKIFISDTGVGIKKKDLKRLFLRFEQLDSGLTRKYEGTGLGLSITKQLVELHGGKIIAESEYGGWSRFTFFLPLVAKKEIN